MISETMPSEEPPSRRVAKTNSSIIETPVTISAFMTGMLFTVIRGVRHRRRILARPMAAKVPATVAISVESTDTSSVV